MVISPAYLKFKPDAFQPSPKVPRQVQVVAGDFPVVCVAEAEESSTQSKRFGATRGTIFAQPR
jgi:hypothetical protein